MRLACGFLINDDDDDDDDRKTEIGTEVAHIIRDLDSTFKVKRSTCRGGGILWRPPTQLVNYDWLL